MRILILTCLISVLCLFTLKASSVELRIEGDRLWLIAKQEPLKNILESFTHAGVKVRFDPSINTRISGIFEDADAEEALEKILFDFGYVLIWNVIQGPVGPFPKLEEIQVFLPGQKKNIRSMPDLSKILRVARSRDGLFYTVLGSYYRPFYHRTHCRSVF